MLALLGPLGALLGLEAGAIKENLVRRAVLWSVIGALGIVAVAFVLVAINTALAYAVGPVIAPLIIAGAALLIAMIVYGIMHLRQNAEAKREADKQRSAEMTAMVTTIAITTLPLLLPTLKKIGLPAGGAAAALYALSRSRTERRNDD